MPMLPLILKKTLKPLLLVMFAIPFTAQAVKPTPSHHHKHAAHKKKKSVAPVDTLSYAARLRMLNRARLLNQYHAEHPKTSVAELAAISTSTRAQRAANRTLVKAHPEWFRGPWKLGDSRWEQVEDNDTFLSHDHLKNLTEVAIHRMEAQLGKPYVWGGTAPETGFDCSGLVFYAYNKVLAEKLPRTADQMYHYRRGVKVPGDALKRGDLLFFHVHSSAQVADHMGVYLGHGQFIESPRTGEAVRVSQLQDQFWQDHFLGARRILTRNTIL